MRVYDIIAKKRDGQKLSLEEIEFIINGYVKDLIPDYQVAALLMAIYFQGLDKEETAHLTKVMTNSGDTIDLSEIEGLKVDKHSTGGVGDTTTIILAPLVAAGGIPVAKMSGRGLGHTGGTIDKLESIPGFITTLEKKDFIKQVNQINVAVIGQSGNLVPADKKIYALRDVTATVNSIPLIASSIMSKKIAAGADRILLDVKMGNGAFVEDLTQAKELAKTMVDIGNSFGKKTVAIISNMNQPLGEAIGNSLEIIEAIETLKGKGPQDLTQLCLELAGQMFFLGGKAKDYVQGLKLAEKLLYSGEALKKLKELISWQEGNVDVLENYSLLPLGQYTGILKSREAGYISNINSKLLGSIAMELGGGREKKDDPIDYGVGLLVKKKIGDYLEVGDPIVEVIANHENDFERVKNKLLAAFEFSPNIIPKPPLIYEKIY